MMNYAGPYALCCGVMGPRRVVGITYLYPPGRGSMGDDRDFLSAFLCSHKHPMGRRLLTAYSRTH